MNNLLGRPSIAIATGWLLGATQPASAALVNGSFESGAFAPDAQGVQFINITGSPIEGWSGFVGGFYWVGPANAYGIVASDGAYSVSLYDPTRPLVRVGSVNQTLATTVGQSYELAFDLGTAGGFSRNVGIRAFAGGQSADFLSAAAGPGMHWERFQLRFTATDSSAVIQLTGLLGAGYPVYGSPGYIGLDNVTLTPLPAVPEPAAWLLLGLGLPLLLARRHG